MTNLIQLFKRKEAPEFKEPTVIKAWKKRPPDEGEPEKFMNNVRGTDQKCRLARIRAQLAKINCLMSELKKMEKGNGHKTDT